MRALVFERAGEPRDVLQLKDIARPAVSAGHVLIQVRARPINPADIAFIRGMYRVQPSYPQNAGLEGFGTVIECGTDVDLPSGTRVAFRWPGSWAEYAAVPAERVVVVPPGISDESGAQLSLNPITAWALIEESQARSGDVIVLTAAASSVAHQVRALAAERGIVSFGVVRGDATRIAELYPDGAWPADEPELAAAIRERAGTRRVQGVIDCVGGPIVSELLPALTPGGRIIAYGVLDARPAAITNAALIYRNLTWLGFGIDRWLEQQGAEKRITAFRDLCALIEAGTLSLPVASRHDLSEFEVALLNAAKPQERGKVLFA